MVWLIVFVSDLNFVQISIDFGYYPIKTPAKMLHKKEVCTPDELEKWQPIIFDGFSPLLLYLGYLFALASCVFSI